MEFTKYTIQEFNLQRRGKEFRFYVNLKERHLYLMRETNVRYQLLLREHKLFSGVEQIIYIGQAHRLRDFQELGNSVQQSGGATSFQNESSIPDKHAAFTIAFWLKAIERGVSKIT